jgi:putative oxidoreductase
MKSFIPTKVAEIIFALAIGTFGVLHFKNADMMGGAVPRYMPGDGKMWIYVTGAALIAAALAIIVNKFKALACCLLAAMLLVFVFTLHLKPAMNGDPGSLGNLLKDIALAMAAIIIGNNSSK